MGHFWEVVCDCFSFRVPPSLVSLWPGAISSSAVLVRPLACCTPVTRPVRRLVVVACLGRLLTLPLPLILWTSKSFPWVARLSLRLGLVVCCVTVGCLGQVLAAYCLTAGCPFGCRVLAPVVPSLVLIPRLPASQPFVLYCLGLLLFLWLGCLDECPGRRLVRCYLTLVCRLLP